MFALCNRLSHSLPQYPWLGWHQCTICIQTMPQRGRDGRISWTLQKGWEMLAHFHLSQANGSFWLQQHGFYCWSIQTFTFPEVTKRKSSNKTTAPLKASLFNVTAVLLLLAIKYKNNLKFRQGNLIKELTRQKIWRSVQCQLWIFEKLYGHILVVLFLKTPNSKVLLQQRFKSRSSITMQQLNKNVEQCQLGTKSLCMIFKSEWQKKEALNQ